MNATPFSHAPVLNEQAFARAFPFYLHVDANLCVLSSGASLRKAYPAVQPGMSLQALFTIRRPRAVDSIEAWRTHGLEACTLVSSTMSWWSMAPPSNVLNVIWYRWWIDPWQ